ncbi:phosphoesterase [Dickeya dadantii]|uniref:alkaline phosphatase family protein n=1 Tax=Dickeya dadantii TaxID=204038 RepID=UPI0014959032|nr:alkaline phosphatase family protein [Dickeya dadantii]NPE56555.1 phosphoesterase [Dickeya dadantii]NPE67835.1 phosphoesterase [Dickeya dadantii]
MANSGLSNIEHIVVLMLENRSFDHMLGFLYADRNNLSPLGHPFAGLTGNETNPDSNGNPVQVFKITPDTPNAYFMPGSDPGEGYYATNSQLFGDIHAPGAPPANSNQGFVTDYAYTLGWQSQESGWKILPGTQAGNIMGCFTPQALPVLSALATGYAVCDHWYGSAPTETLPNRAFVSAATSQGHMNDKTKSYTCPSIFGRLSQSAVTWSIYGYDQPPLTRHNFPDTQQADDSHFGLFSDFQQAARNGTLASYVFLEPSWGEDGNSQHPVADVALGEQLIHDVYYALRTSPLWNKTLLIITYDEHGGCYDHLPPPWNATPPDASTGEYGFDFTRFGPRVPTVLVSPWIEAGTVFRVADQTTPLDHTSILKTVQQRWALSSLTNRDAAAPGVGDVLTLATPRTDDPLTGVTVPSSTGKNPAQGMPSHLQQVHAELVSELPVSDAQGGMHHQMPDMTTAAEYADYIRQRTQNWLNSR